MPPDVERLAYSAMRSILIVVVVIALIATALAPKRPHWRLLPMEDKAAGRIRWLVVGLAVTHGLTLFLSTVRFVSNAPFTLTVAQSCVSSIIIAAAGHRHPEDAAQRGQHRRRAGIRLDRPAAMAALGHRRG